MLIYLQYCLFIDQWCYFPQCNSS